MAGILDQEGTPEDNPSKNYYEDLVGEGKSFKDNEALAKGKYMADMHIKMLETRMDEMRELYLKEQSENQTKAKLEDLLKTLETRQQTASSAQTPSERVPEKPTFDINELDNLMSKKLEQGLTAYEQANKQKENTKVVVDKLRERYGNNYQSLVKEQIQSLGMSEDMFNTMVKDAPSALLRTLGIEGQTRESFQTPPRSEQNFQFKGPAKRDWAYYQNLKKSNPKAYMDPKTLIQMEKDALALGDAFNDGNFDKPDRQLMKERLGW